MKIEVKMTNDVYEEVHTLMHHNKTLNDGNEIGAWLTGDWKVEEDTAVLTLDKFIIPKQTVTGTEVDISPESMIDTVQELGVEESNRIQAHWHIHPFNTGDTDWSQTDEEKITDFMNPQKGREVFVFLLSSLDKLKARVELNTKTTVWGQEIIERRKIDNIEVTPLEPISNELVEKLKDRITEKVSTKTYTQTSFANNHYSGLGNYNNHRVFQDLEGYTIKTKKNKIILKIEKDIVRFMRKWMDTTFLDKYEETQTHRSYDMFIYKTGKDTPDLEQLKTLIETELEEVIDEMNKEEEMKASSTNMGYDDYYDEHWRARPYAMGGYW